jgi:hypothetical protein
MTLKIDGRERMMHGKLLSGFSLAIRNVESQLPKVDQRELSRWTAQDRFYCDRSLRDNATRVVVRDANFEDAKFAQAGRA